MSGNLFFEMFIRIIASVWVYQMWNVYRQGEFPLKLRGFDKTLLVYTSWRMYLLLGVPLILVAIPVFIYGAEYLAIFNSRAQPILVLLFLLSMVLIPASWIIATISQVIANRNEKPKRKVNDLY